MGIHDEHVARLETRKRCQAQQNERDEAALASISEEQGGRLERFFAHATSVWGRFAKDVAPVEALALFPPLPAVYYRDGCAGYEPEGSPRAKGEVFEIGPVWTVAEPYPNLGNEKRGGCSNCHAHWYSRQGDLLWRLEFPLPTRLVNFRWESGSRRVRGYWSCDTSRMTRPVGRHRPDVRRWGYRSFDNKPGRRTFDWPVAAGGETDLPTVPTFQETLAILTYLHGGGDAS